MINQAVQTATVFHERGSIKALKRLEKILPKIASLSKRGESVRV